MISISTENNKSSL